MRFLSSWDIITVSFNNAQQIQRNWEWFRESPKNINWIVVDNNSSDNSVEIAVNLGAKIIKLHQNIGFAKANNIGFERSFADYVLFANPDLMVNPMELKKIEENLLEKPGLCSPQLLNPNGSYQQNGRGFPYLSAKFAHRDFPIFKNTWKAIQYLPDIQENKLYPVEWLMGAAVCATREDFKAIGRWNENYFVYYEDHELGIRAKRLGYNVTIDSRIMWTHEWARETTNLSLKAWKNEILSAIKFYRTHPRFLK